MAAKWFTPGEEMDVFNDLVRTYGSDGARKIWEIAARLKKRGVPDSARLKWAKNEYEYQRNAASHETGYDPEEDERYVLLIMMTGFWS